MPNKISYGPHLFPGGPAPYIRTYDLVSRTHHRDIILALSAAFSNEVPNNILPQLAKLGVDSDSSVNLSFMNYGNTQLVYLATIANKVKVAVLINQPHTPLGKVREEFDNLGRLVEFDPRFVVKPYAHFELHGHELYASEYVDNALCVAVHTGHGVYDPLPNYHFERFMPGVSSAVNSAMIALLVNYYDAERKRGLAKTQICGNDFMLTRDFRKEDSTTVQPNMRLIAARGFIDASLDEYLDMLRREFLMGTRRENYDVFLRKPMVNQHSVTAMTGAEIEAGIKTGLELRLAK